MSYVIQNFTPASTSLRISAKLKSSFILRNCNAVATLMFSSPLRLLYMSHSLAAYRQLLIRQESYFTQLVPVLFTGLQRLKYVPLETNFSRTAYYTSLLSILDRNSSHSRTQPGLFQLSVSPRGFLNPYFNGTSVGTVSVSNRAFLFALHKFMHLLLMG